MIRFNNLAFNVETNSSVENWLRENKFSEFFIANYVLPMSSAIWSSSQESIKRFPMKSLSSFFKNHGLLNLIRRPQWFTVLGGSDNYVEKIINVSNIILQPIPDTLIIDIAESPIAVAGANIIFSIIKC
mgnify:CR=1 FL=1